MLPSHRVPIWFLLANMLLVLVAFYVGVQLGGRRLPRLPEPQNSALHLVHRAIVTSHVDPHDPAALLDAAIAAMAKVDEYSRYVPPSEVGRFEEDTTGTYEGIGVLVSMPREEIVVRFPFPNGPAERAGMMVGDRILAVDGARLDEVPREQRSRMANQHLRGPAGSAVRILVARADRDAFEITVRRGPVQKASIKWVRLLDAAEGLGYLYLTDFHRDTAAEFAAAVTQLQQQTPGGLRGLVLDLRFNGGGLLEECLALCRALLPAGNIVTTKRRDSEVVQSFDAIPEQCRFPDLPLVLLQNQHSASASEVLAGALQDHRRASVVGVRSYGKGTVNTIFRWEELDFRLKLTTAHYYTPNGRNIEKRHRRQGDGDGDGQGGIEPDVAVAVDEALQRRLLERLLDHEVPERYRDAVAELSTALGLELPEQLGPEQDPQLAAALTELRRRLRESGQGNR